MAKLTKRARMIAEKVEARDYDVNEAITLLKELATAKFTESVDVAVNLGIDARKSDQNVRGATVLPLELRPCIFPGTSYGLRIGRGIIPKTARSATLTSLAAVCPCGAAVCACGTAVCCYATAVYALASLAHGLLRLRRGKT